MESILIWAYSIFLVIAMVIGVISGCAFWIGLVGAAREIIKFIDKKEEKTG